MYKLISKDQVGIVLATSLLLPVVIFSILALLFLSSSSCELNWERTGIHCFSRQIALVIYIDWGYDNILIWRRNVFDGSGAKLGPPWWGFSMSEAIMRVVGLVFLLTVGIAIVTTLIIIVKNYYLRSRVGT